MTTEYETAPGFDEAMNEATSAGAGSPIDGFVERMAERIGAKASVQAVFGEPIERDGITVIPVAKVRWGFGGGAGRGPDTEEGPTGSGSGGGGGATADPIGYIEIGPDGAVFKPIVSAMPSPGFLLAAAASAALLLRGVARLFRR